jgi:lipopolysaccharide biosynthesis regulator YciM
MWETIKNWFFGLPGAGLVIWLVTAFAAGVVADRLLSSVRTGNIKGTLDKGDEAFFQGVQYLLSNEPDHAIEQFTKSVQINSETIETYVALANLYSSKGDFERAIRIRKGIILRPNLDPKIRLRAIFDLGLDYKKGGFLDRALAAFQEYLDSDPNNIEALEQIERISEDIHDWEQAFKTRKAIAKLVAGYHRPILAHQQTEIGKNHEKNGDLAAAEKCYKEALSIHHSCVDALLHLGDLYFSRNEYRKALST